MSSEPADTVGADRTGPAWWVMDPAEASAVLDVDTSVGLAEHEVLERRRRFGSNELDEEPERPQWMIFLSQFANTMIIVLIGAMVVTVLIDEVLNAVVIGAIVVLNAIVGFIQEYRAEQAMRALRQMAAPTARVVRDGTSHTVRSTDLVPGDVVIVETGDIVPAGLRLLECPNLRVNEATLTGESVPVDKSPDAMAEGDGEMISDRRNMAFKGTAVVNGRARGLVVATGMSTELGRVAGLLGRDESRRTPLQLRLDVLGRRLAVASVALCAVVFAAGIARGEDASLMFLTAVSLAVAAIPEALPAVVTVALALGAQRLVTRGALVRRLPAVETLGSVTVICTDKTGTLTESRMLVERVWTPLGELEATGSGFEPTGSISEAGSTLLHPGTPTARLLRAAVLCNDAELLAPTENGGSWEVAGDPTEGALLALAAKAGVQRSEVAHRWPRTDEAPFDSDRKRMTTVHRDDAGRWLIATKGAVEAVLGVADQIATADRDRPLTDTDRDGLLARSAALAAEGYRVLALAERSHFGAGPQERAAGELENRVTVLGLVAMADPPRVESAAAVAACRSAGITVVMITGDHPATASAIARRLGILTDEQVMTGAELASGKGRLESQVDRVAVYARTTPEQKLDIVRARQARGDVVAMTGDGVNDAPALHAADIGVAMGMTGTEVAKEAADMVLSNDDFATIVAAVAEGRRIYDNVRRFVRYLLTSNSGEIWVMLLGPFFGLPLPLLPVQILWVNLVTDSLPALALGVEPAEAGVMRRSPRSPTESVFAQGLWQHVILVGLLMGLIPISLGVWGEASGRPWQTMVFMSLAMLQVGHALAVRSERQSLFQLGMTSNRPLLAAVVITLAIQLAVVYVPVTQRLLEVEALSLFELGIVLLASTGAFWAVEAEKAFRRSRERRPASLDGDVDR